VKTSTTTTFTAHALNCICCTRLRSSSILLILDDGLGFFAFGVTFMGVSCKIDTSVYLGFFGLVLLAWHAAFQSEAGGRTYFHVTSSTNKGA
jgi:hypothetical protein